MAVTKPYVSTRKRVKAAAETKAAPKKLGRPAGSKNKPKTDKPVDWEKLAKRLQYALAAEMKLTQELNMRIAILEDRSWLSRLFNLKG